jgi:hypothetical protein
MTSMHWCPLNLEIEGISILRSNLPYFLRTTIRYSSQNALQHELPGMHPFSGSAMAATYTRSSCSIPTCPRLRHPETGDRSDGEDRTLQQIWQAERCYMLENILYACDNVIYMRLLNCVCAKFICMCNFLICISNFVILICVHVKRMKMITPHVRAIIVIFMCVKNLCASN